MFFVYNKLKYIWGDCFKVSVVVEFTMTKDILSMMRHRYMRKAKKGNSKPGARCRERNKRWKFLTKARTQPALEPCMMNTAQIRR